MVEEIGYFRAAFCQNESSCETINQMKMCFPFNSGSFSYERFCARTRFETEAKGNMEMSHYAPVHECHSYLASSVHTNVI